MIINGIELDEVQVKLFQDVVKKCKQENRRDFDNVFSEVMQDRIIKFNLAMENMDIIVANIDNRLKREGY